MTHPRRAAAPGKIPRNDTLLDWEDGSVDREPLKITGGSVAVRYPHRRASDLLIEPATGLSTF